MMPRCDCCSQWHTSFPPGCSRSSAFRHLPGGFWLKQLKGLLKLGGLILESHGQKPGMLMIVKVTVTVSPAQPFLALSIEQQQSRGWEITCLGTHRATVTLIPVILEREVTPETGLPSQSLLLLFVYHQGHLQGIPVQLMQSFPLLHPCCGSFRRPLGAGSWPTQLGIPKGMGMGLKLAAASVTGRTSSPLPSHFLPRYQKYHMREQFLWVCL